MVCWPRAALVEYARLTRKTYNACLYDSVERCVREKHFLRDYWFAPNEKAAARSYVRQQERKPRPVYVNLLLLAIVQTPGFCIPDDTTTGELELLSTDEARAEFRALLSKRLERNRDVVNPCPAVLADDMQQCVIDHAYARDDATTRPLRELRATLSNSLPPVAMVTSRMGPQAGALYRETLENLENGGGGLDVDEALATGAEMRWDPERLVQRVSQVQLYADVQVLDEREAADRIREWRQRRRRPRPVYTDDAVGLWVVRGEERKMWQQRISDDEWQRYTETEIRLRSCLPRGRYQHLTRRHYSEPAVHEMPANLLAISQYILRTTANHRDDADAGDRVPAMDGTKSQRTG